MNIVEKLRRIIRWDLKGFSKFWKQRTQSTWNMWSINISEVTRKLNLPHALQFIKSNYCHLQRWKTSQFLIDLRKLEAKYFEEKPSVKRNIIKDYIELDSQIYAPLVRNGTSMDVLNPAPPFRFDLHRDFESKLTDHQVIWNKWRWTRNVVTFWSFLYISLR